MNPRPTVADIRSYLGATGWRQRPETWQEASIWANSAGHEVLVPPTDDLADNDLRVREILTVLTAAERRPRDEIAGDISAPFADTLSCRTFPDGQPAGFTSLPAGLRGLHGVRDLVCAAARTVVEGPLPAFPGGTPPAVGELLHRVQLGPARAGSYVLTVRVPLDGRPDGSPPPLGRRVCRQLYAAVAAARSAAVRTADERAADERAADERAADHEPGAFDEAVDEGVSANLCEALSGLAGGDRRQPFEVSFRWGRGIASEVPAGTVRFPSGAGAILFAAATRLRRYGAAGDAAVTGVVESLYDQAQGTDRWRVKVRGDLTSRAGTAPARTVWVRLNGPEPYDLAIAAHQTKRRVRVQGVLAARRGRTELIVSGGGFAMLDP